MYTEWTDSYGRALGRFVAYDIPSIQLYRSNPGEGIQDPSSIRIRELLAAARIVPTSDSENTVVGRVPIAGAPASPIYEYLDTTNSPFIGTKDTHVFPVCASHYESISYAAWRGCE